MCERVSVCARVRKRHAVNVLQGGRETGRARGQEMKTSHARAHSRTSACACACERVQERSREREEKASKEKEKQKEGMHVRKSAHARVHV